MSRPGWHPDPAGSGQERWWDGATWTQQFRPAAAQAPVAPAAPIDPDTIWEATGKPLTKVGAGRYRLTDKYLFFEKGMLSTKAQQIPIHELHDVDAKQSMSQKARGVGTITISVHRSSGVEVVHLEDIPNFREGVQKINKAAHAERERIQTRANTQTFQHSGTGPVHPSAPPAGAPAPAAAPAAPAGDPIEQLERLGKLRDAGVVSPEEFETKKAELLSRL